MLRAVVIALLGGSLLALPAQADLLEWFDRQFEETPSEPLIERIEPAAWTPSIVDGQLIGDDIEPAAGETKCNRFLASCEEDSSTGSSSGSGALFGGQSEGNRPPLLKDGLTELRRSATGVIRHDAMQSYLDGLMARVLSHSPITGAPIRVKLTGSRSPGDAKAFHDGHIGIPLGALQEAESEDEIAFLLAHEAAHVLLNHHDSDWLANTNKQLTSASEIALSSMIQVSDALARYGGDSKEFKEIQAIAWVAGQVTLFVTDDALRPSWAREQEIEADRLGLDLALRAGYSHEGAFDFLLRLATYEESNPSGGNPAIDRRRQKLEERMNRAEAEGDVDEAFTGAFEGAFIEVESVIDDLRTTHPDTRERLDKLVEYYEELWEEELDYVEPQSGGWTKVRQAASSEDLFKRYNLVWEASNALGDERLDEAARLIRAAIGPPTRHKAYPRYVFAQVRMNQGNTDKQRQNLALAMKDAEPNLIIYRDAIAFDYAKGKSLSGDRLVNEAWSLFGRPPELYPYKIYLAVRKDDRASATRLNAECRLIFRDQSRLCSEAMNGHPPWVPLEEQTMLDKLKSTN